MDGYLFKQHNSVSEHSGYDANSHSYVYYTQWQHPQSRPQQHPRQGDHGTQYVASQFGYSIPTPPPPKPHAITGVTVIVDTNVLLDYLMVVQKFVADIERMKWPSVVVIPSVVISELDWCVCPTPAR